MHSYDFEKCSLCHVPSGGLDFCFQKTVLSLSRTFIWRLLMLTQSPHSLRCRIMGTVLTMLMLCSLAFKPLYESPSHGNHADSTKVEPILSNFVNRTIWKNKKYLIWVIAVPFSLSGYFVPYVHMVSSSKYCALTCLLSKQTW